MTDSLQSNKNSFFGLDISPLNSFLYKIQRLISENILLIEFSHQSLIIAEISVSSNQIQINKVIKTNLPSEALDRSIPTDPEKISDLIKTICKEKRILSNLCYVIISPEAVFNKIINLPSDLNIEEAVNYALIPNPLLQIPIPLHQTDFDLEKTSINTIQKDNKKYTSYFLRSIPKELVDKLIESLNLSDLKLCYLDSPSIAFSRLVQEDLERVQDDSTILVIEFLKHCTYLYAFNKSSTLSTIRLPSIRNFPEPNKNILEEKIKKPHMKLEDLIKQQDDYLPISKLDLKVFLKELKLFLNNFIKDNKYLKPEKIYITGVNSSYPEITNLISNELDIETLKLNLITNKYFGNINIPNELFTQEISRIFGLALSLLEEKSYKLSEESQAFISKSKNIDRLKNSIDQQKLSKVDSYSQTKVKINEDKLDNVNHESKKIISNNLDLNDDYSEKKLKKEEKVENEKSIASKKEKETKKINLSDSEKSLKNFEDEKKLKKEEKVANEKLLESKNKNPEKPTKRSIKDEPLSFND